MGNIIVKIYILIDYINNKKSKIKKEEIKPKKYIDELYIINKYYLDRLFNNFIDDKSPKHYLNLECSKNKDNLIYNSTLIIYQLIDKLQNSKYKYFVKNNSIAGNNSIETIKKAIIHGLYIIDNNNTNNINSNIEFKIFIEYIFYSLIEMFKSINGDYKKLHNNIKYENIINNIYNKLFGNYETINIQKIEHIIYLLTLINKSDKLINEKLNIIYSLLIEIN